MSLLHEHLVTATLEDAVMPSEAMLSCRCSVLGQQQAVRALLTITMRTAILEATFCGVERVTVLCSGMEPPGSLSSQAA